MQEKVCPNSLESPALCRPLLCHIERHKYIKRSRVEAIGREYFLQIKAHNQPAYFVNFAGLNGVL
jgi:hypothetical protein